jgi:hypothetical protein
MRKKPPGVAETVYRYSVRADSFSDSQKESVKIKRKKPRRSRSECFQDSGPRMSENTISVDLSEIH